MNAAQTALAPFPLRQVLVLADLTPESANAAWRAGLLAREQGAVLRLLHVAGGAAAQRTGQASLDALAQQLQQQLQIEVIVQVARGSLRRELAAAAADADLLVLRARMRGWRDLLAGWRPERVLQPGQRPTLVVRRPTDVGYRRVLVAAAWDERAAAHIAAGAAMVRGPHRAVFEAVQAQGALDAAPQLRDARVRGPAHHAAQRLRALVQTVFEAHESSRGNDAPAVVFDPGPQALLEKERSLWPELLVMAPPAAQGWRKWLESPACREVLAQTSADVLLLGPETPPPPAAAEAAAA